MSKKQRSTIMPPKKRETKKIKQRKHLIKNIVRPVLFVTIALLALSVVTMVARSISATPLDHSDGVPAHWQASTAELPDQITVPVTYYDQKSEACSVPTETRQFEFTRCNISSAVVQPGIVKDTLGEDDLPIPSNVTTNKSFLSTSWGVTGNDPVQPTDNFYRWFHEVEGKSKEIAGRSITFDKIGDKLYKYGGGQIFPLDDVDFSAGDYAATMRHNFHFTMKMSTPFYVTGNDDEYFDFEGDDDVWVFVNGKLVLDIGGLHKAIKGHFKINPDLTITATVDGKTTTVDAGLTKGMLTTIDFFYAERSTTEANCIITINGMLQPISTIPTLAASLTEDGLIEYTATLQNNDSYNSVTVEGFASHITENATVHGFLNLDGAHLSHRTASTDWAGLDIGTPSLDESGFQLDSPVTLAPRGTAGDTLYLRYRVEPDEDKSHIDNVASFLVSRGNLTSVTAADAPIEYTAPEDTTPPGDENPPTDETPPEDDNVDDEIIDDDTLDEDPEGPLDPLGVDDFIDVTVPNTGLASFATIILSQYYLLGILGAFAVSFAIYWQVRKY